MLHVLTENLQNQPACILLLVFSIKTVIIDLSMVFSGTTTLSESRILRIRWPARRLVPVTTRRRIILQRIRTWRIGAVRPTETADKYQKK